MAYAERTIPGTHTEIRWLGRGELKGHAFPAMKGQPLEVPGGVARPVCGKPQSADTLGQLFKGKCANCVRLLADEPKKSTGLSERQTEVVATGSTHGCPEDAERKRAGEIAAISGDALKRNAEAVAALRAGDKGLATAIARNVDESAAKMPTGRRTGKKGAREIIPTAPSAKRPAKPVTRDVTAGQRGEASIDGAALVKGGNMAPVQPRSGWVAKAGTLAAPVGRERVDPGALGPIGKHDRDNNPQCHAFQCEHIYGDLPANHKEAITCREYIKLSRTGQRAHQRVVRRAEAELKRAAERERAKNRRTPQYPGAACEMGPMDDDGRGVAASALMGAPGYKDGLSYQDREGMSVR